MIVITSYNNVVLYEIPEMNTHIKNEILDIAR